MKTLERPRVQKMLQIKFEGSEKELREYIRKNNFSSPRIILLEDSPEQEEISIPASENWKGKLTSVRKDAQPERKKRIRSYLGAVKGVYSSPEEAVSIIRNERELWD